MIIINVELNDQDLMTDRNLWGLRATQYQASLHQPPLALVWWNISVFMDSEFLALPPSWVSWCLTRQLADFSTTIQLLEVFVSAISDGCRHWENVIHTNDNSQISSNYLPVSHASCFFLSYSTNQLWYITRLGDLNDVWHHFTNKAF